MVNTLPLRSVMELQLLEPDLFFRKRMIPNEHEICLPTMKRKSHGVKHEVYKRMQLWGCTYRVTIDTGGFDTLLECVLYFCPGDKPRSCTLSFMNNVLKKLDLTHESSPCQLHFFNKWLWCGDMHELVVDVNFHNKHCMHDPHVKLVVGNLDRSCKVH